jgi:hypothetical protein
MFPEVAVELYAIVADNPSAAGVIAPVPEYDQAYENEPSGVTV